MNNQHLFQILGYKINLNCWWDYQQEIVGADFDAIYI